MTTTLKVVGARADTLHVRFRVAFRDDFLAALEERRKLAARFGKVDFVYGAFVAEMKYARARGVFHLGTSRFQCHVDLHAQGSVERYTETGERADEAGWTLQVVWDAQTLADWGLDRCLDESYALAHLLGAEVHEGKLDRVDLAVDVAGWEILPDDVDHIVKRPRARKDWTDNVDELDWLGLAPEEKMRMRVAAARADVARMLREQADDVEARGIEDCNVSVVETGKLGGRRRVSGISVGRGGPIMLRIYDKRRELAAKCVGDDAKREAEESRWRARGWNGHPPVHPDEVEPVTRIEFQIRGCATKELGIRDPLAVAGPVMGTNDHGRAVVVGQRVLADDDGQPMRLTERVPFLWSTMLDWARLVVPDESVKVATRLADDPRWALLRTVRFYDFEPVRRTIGRFRQRKAASEAQALGVALSQAGKAGELATVDAWSDDEAAYVGRAAYETLRERVRAVCAGQVERIVLWLLERNGNDVQAANVHLALRARAARARNLEVDGLGPPRMTRKEEGATTNGAPRMLGAGSLFA